MYSNLRLSASCGTSSNMRLMAGEAGRRESQTAGKSGRRRRAFAPLMQSLLPLRLAVKFFLQLPLPSNTFFDEVAQEADSLKSEPRLARASSEADDHGASITSTLTTSAFMNWHRDPN